MPSQAILGRDAFRQLVEYELKPQLSNHGFRRKRYVWSRNGEEVRQLIDYRLDRHNPPAADEVRFTVGLGVVSYRLCHFYGISAQTVRWDDCHWRMRLGFLLPEKRDVWWTIGDRLAETVKQEQKGYLLSVALPELGKRLRDDQLLDEWLSGSSPGLTAGQRLMNILILGRSLRPDHDWSSTATQLLEMAKRIPVRYQMTSESIAKLWPEFSAG